MKSCKKAPNPSKYSTKKQIPCACKRKNTKPSRQSVLFHCCCCEIVQMVVRTRLANTNCYFAPFLPCTTTMATMMTMHGTTLLLFQVVIIIMMQFKSSQLPSNHPSILFSIVPPFHYAPLTAIALVKPWGCSKMALPIKCWWTEPKLAP